MVLHVSLPVSIHLYGQIRADIASRHIFYKWPHMRKLFCYNQEQQTHRGFQGSGKTSDKGTPARKKAALPASCVFSVKGWLSLLAKADEEAWVVKANHP